VGDEVQGEVEGTDRTDDAARLSQRERELADAGLRRVHRHHVPGQLAGLDRRERVGRHGARRLDAGRLDRLAGFGGDRAGDLLMAASEAGRDTDQDLGSLVRRERVLQRLLGGVERAAHLGRAAFRDPSHHVAGVRRADLAPLAGLHPLAADQEAPLGRRGRHATQSRALGVS